MTKEQTALQSEINRRLTIQAEAIELHPWRDATHDQVFRALIPEYSIPALRTADDAGAHERRAVTREDKAATVATKSRAT